MRITTPIGLMFEVGGVNFLRIPVLRKGAFSWRKGLFDAEAFLSGALTKPYIGSGAKTGARPKL